ncbi:MAG: PhnP protein [Clostridia bacterium]|nr:PhnP protein [Clostridia bacterium]
MKLHYLGTAAAEGIPSLFCQCDACENARKKGGKEIRTRSQALIDDCLLIDFPADSHAHMLKYGIDMTKINNCLITHIHGDHLYPGEFGYIHFPFSARLHDGYTFTVHGSEAVKERVEFIGNNPDGRFRFNELAPFTPTEIDGYTVTALKARHGSPHPRIFIIEKNGKTLLYAHDTDIPKEETLDYIKESGVRFDLVSADCTEGAYEDLSYHGHMCLGRNIKFRQILTDMGAIDKNTKYVLNHFSHNGPSVDYESFTEIAGKEGFTVSYDGMVVEI